MTDIKPSDALFHFAEAFCLTHNHRYLTSVQIPTSTTPRALWLSVHASQHLSSLLWSTHTFSFFWLARSPILHRLPLLLSPPQANHRLNIQPVLSRHVHVHRNIHFLLRHIRREQKPPTQVWPNRKLFFDWKRIVCLSRDAHEVIAVPKLETGAFSVKIIHVVCEVVQGGVDVELGRMARRAPLAALGYAGGGCARGWLWNWLRGGGGFGSRGMPPPCAVKS